MRHQNTEDLWSLRVLIVGVAIADKVVWCYLLIFKGYAHKVLHIKTFSRLIPSSMSPKLELVFSLGEGLRCRPPSPLTNIGHPFAFLGSKGLSLIETPA
jgi:hypothetical protein